MNIHIIVLTEHWLSEDKNQFYNIPGYKSFFSNRSDAYAGAAIYISENISCTLSFEEEFEESNFLIVKLNKMSINIMCVYRSHDTPYKNFFEKIDELTSKYSNTLILGDINIDLLDVLNRQVVNYRQTLESNGFVICNKISKKFATRITSTSSTIIDHFITDLVKTKYDMHILDTGLSDHQMIFISCNFKPIKETLTHTIKVLNYDCLENDDDWINLNIHESFDDLVPHISSIINKHTSIKTKKSQKSSPWITEEISNTIKIRDSFAKYKKKYPNDTHVSDSYKFYKQKVRCLIREARKIYLSAELLKYANNAQKLWSLYKQIMFNSQTTSETNITKLQINNVFHEDTEEIANILNHNFVNITNSLNFSSDIDYTYINQFRQNIYTDFDLTQTNSNEIKLIIDSLNNNSAIGFDCISAKFIKKYETKLNSILVHYINTSFENGIFPNALKPATVTPIYKSGEKSNPNNYRPISILSSFSKIFEKVVKDRLETFLRNNGILSERQFGFENNSNTTAACLALTDFISKSLDSKNFTAVVFLDIKKAFDCVDHKILIQQLKNLNFNCRQIKFFKSYLQGRPQRVRLGSVMSSLKTILKGIPQGSILGPILFKIYIDSITRLNLKGNIQLFADDGAVKYSEKSEEDLRAAITHDLKLINEWLEKHNLALNVSKTKILFFENKTLSNTTFTLNNETIEIVKKFNYLGLILDSKFNMNDHVDHICKKITPYIFIMKRLKNYLNETALFSIFSSYIMSHLIYLNSIWSCCGADRMAKLNILHKKAIKIIKGYPRRYPTDRLYSIKYPSLDLICKRELQ
jgi:hypothetical protein